MVSKAIINQSRCFNMSNVVISVNNDVKVIIISHMTAFLETTPSFIPLSMWSLPVIHESGTQATPPQPEHSRSLPDIARTYSQLQTVPSSPSRWLRVYDLQHTLLKPLISSIARSHCPFIPQ